MIEMLSDPNNRPSIARQLSIALDRSVSHNYSASGGATVVGQGAGVGGGIQSTYHQSQQSLDLNALVKDLEHLRRKLKTQSSAPEHDIAIGQVAMAEEAARKGDEAGALSALKSAGIWVLGVAEKIGVNVASQALRVSLGL
jgi:hypothetical protein